MSLSVKDFLWTQLVLKIPLPTSSFASKTVIVTGANSGLGKEAVQHIVKLGAERVILACRNLAKANDAKAAIEKSTACRAGILEVWQLDLESPASIQKFAARAKDLPRLDVLINNAGINAQTFRVAQGTESTIAVNVISTFQLSLLLLPKLKETAQRFDTTPHLTFVGSALHMVAKYPDGNDGDIFAWLGREENVDMMNQYNLSKLLLVYLLRYLATQVKPSLDAKSESNSVIVNCLDPCFCRTDLSRDLQGGIKAFFKVFQFLFARTAEEGSRLVVQTASAGKETHGGYMRGGVVRDCATRVTDDKGVETSRHLWKQLAARLEEVQPGIMAESRT